MTLTLHPTVEEIAVAIVQPGEVATVLTAEGVGTIPGASDGPVVTFVPFDPVAVGWAPGVRSVTHSAPGAPSERSLRRIVRGHRLDAAVWTEARQLLAKPPHVVYVRVIEWPYWSRTRWTAIALRTVTP